MRVVPGSWAWAWPGYSSCTARRVRRVWLLPRPRLCVGASTATPTAAAAGGFNKFEQLGLDRTAGGWLPTWMKALNYSTYFTGKFINGFNVVSQAGAGWRGGR